MKSLEPGESWMTLLAGIWKHTPLAIMIDALMKPTRARRANSLHRDQIAGFTAIKSR